MPKKIWMDVGDVDERVCVVIFHLRGMRVAYADIYEPVDLLLPPEGAGGGGGGGSGNVGIGGNGSSAGSGARVGIGTRSAEPISSVVIPLETAVESMWIGGGIVGMGASGCIATRVGQGVMVGAGASVGAAVTTTTGAGESALAFWSSTNPTRFHPPMTVSTANVAIAVLAPAVIFCCLRLGVGLIMSDPFRVSRSAWGVQLIYLVGKYLCPPPAGRIPKSERSRTHR